MPIDESPSVHSSDDLPTSVTVPGALEIADDLGIDLAFCARPVAGGGPRIAHRGDSVWPGASLYKVAAAIALCRLHGEELSAPVHVGPERRVSGGAGLSQMQDPVTVTWRELMRFMLTGSDNTSAAVILEEVGMEAVEAVTRDAGMSHSRIGSSADTVRRATRASREGGFDQGTDLDDELVEYAREDAVLGSLTTAEDQVRLLSALWRGELLDETGGAVVRGMLGQQVAKVRISRTLSYSGVSVASKTGSWGPFRHDSAVVTHEGEEPIAVCVLTRSLDFDRLLPAVDDGIGEIASLITDAVRTRADLRAP